MRTSLADEYLCQNDEAWHTPNGAKVFVSLEVKHQGYNLKGRTAQARERDLKLAI